MVSKTILLAEDNPDETLIFKRAFKRAALPHRLLTVEDGQQVIDWLSGTGAFSDRSQFPLPDVVVLDLKMPIKTGFEALEWIRNRPETQQLPAIILTSSDDPADFQRAKSLQATCFFVKSPQLLDLMDYLLRN